VRPTLQLCTLQCSHLATNLLLRLAFFVSHGYNSAWKFSYRLGSVPRDHVRLIKIGENRRGYEISSKLEANGTFENSRGRESEK